MIIKIGEAVSLKSPDGFTITPDDRQEIIQTDGGNVIQDYGHVASGDKIAFSCNFRKTDFEKIYQYWEHRELVDVEFGGVTFPSSRIKIISWGFFERFENTTVNARIEIWRM